MAALSPGYFTNTKKLRNNVIKNDYLKIWHCEHTQGTTLLVLLAQKKGGKKQNKTIMKLTNRAKGILCIPKPLGF